MGNNKQNTIDEIAYSLRVMNITFDTCTQIKSELEPVFQCEISSLSTDSLGLILIENIEQYSNYSKLIATLSKYKINNNQLNIFIAFTTQSDISGFTVSKKVTDFYLKIGGSIDISIITINE
jgi:hypothetical protein